MIMTGHSIHTSQEKRRLHEYQIKVAIEADGENVVARTPNALLNEARFEECTGFVEMRSGSLVLRKDPPRRRPWMSGLRRSHRTNRSPRSLVPRRSRARLGSARTPSTRDDVVRGLRAASIPWI